MRQHLQTGGTHINSQSFDPGEVAIALNHCSAIEFVGSLAASTDAAGYSEPQKLDTKVPVLILTRVLADELTSPPRILPE